MPSDLSSHQPRPNGQVVTTPKPSPQVGSASKLHQRVPATYLCKMIVSFYETPSSSSQKSSASKIVHFIIQDLPIETLLHLRHLSHLFHDVVASLSLYRLTATHTVTSILACLRFNLSHNLTLTAIYDFSTTDKCIICGEFALHIFTPTLQWCCRSCVISPPDNDFQVYQISATKYKKLSRYEDGSFRIIRSVPSTSPSETWVMRVIKAREVIQNRQWLVAAKRVPEGMGVSVAPAAAPVTVGTHGSDSVELLGLQLVDCIASVGFWPKARSPLFIVGLWSVILLLSHSITWPWFWLTRLW